MLKDAGGLEVVNDSEVLGERLLALFADKAQYQQAVNAAQTVVVQNRGALDKHLQFIENALD